MKKKNSSSGFTVRVTFSAALITISAIFLVASFRAKSRNVVTGQTETANKAVFSVVPSYQNDVSPRLRDMTPLPVVPDLECALRENPKIPNNHFDQPDLTIQSKTVSFGALQQPKMPAANLNFDGINYPGVGCSCAPPDTDGAVGLTQYVAQVNEGIQVFNKNTGASVLGPIATSTIWQGFGGVCEARGSGDGIVLYDRIDNRWIISQFAGINNITDECIAVSTTSDATGSYYRYGFHLGSNFFDYPKLGVWPDAYYMSMNVFNAAGTAYLGPQAFAFDRANMLVGNPATFISPGITGGPNENPFLPSDLDGTMLPPSGAPNSFVEWPGFGTYNVYHFHVDFSTPANSTFTLFDSPSAAGFTELCPNVTPCVPEAGVTPADYLDGLADRLMFRAAYRNFGDHESLVTNYTVNANGVAGLRWLELRNLTAGPVTVFQESTYQPDTTWRWMGSVAQDSSGDLAVGFSASSLLINPQIRYAGRLALDPLNTLAQGETTLFAGTGSQTATGNRWGDYSAMSVDPVDDCTFWYTNEYYSANASFSWHTRIGNFGFPQCVPQSPSSGPPVSLTMSSDASNAQGGSTIGFTVTLNNPGANTAGGLSFADNLPSGTAINWSIDAGNTDAGWSVVGSPPNQSLVYSGNTLASGAQSRAHIVSNTTTTGSCQLYKNIASFSTSNNAGSGSSVASVSVDCSPTPTPTATPTPTPTPTPTIQVVVQTNPAGLAFSVDGVNYTATQTFSWVSGSPHTIATTSPQAVSSDLRYLWSNWSGGGAISHSVAPTRNTTYTANFVTQYFLTMIAGTGGKVSPNSSWKNAGTNVSIGATPTNNTQVSYSFSGWSGSGTGSYSGTNNPASITMNGPITETASFTQGPVQVTVQTSVTGLNFSVDGTAYTAPQTFSWVPGSSHTIATTSPQSGGTGVQYLWRNWNDNGAISHGVAPTTNKTYIANFTTQYFLTMTAGAGGKVSPMSGWKNSGTSVSINAMPSSGFSFSGWTGSGTGSFSGTTNPTTITIGGPISETAAFTHN